MTSKAQVERIAKQFGDLPKDYIEKLKHDEGFVYKDGIDYTYYFMGVTNAVVDQALCEIGNKTVRDEFVNCIKLYYTQLRDDDLETNTDDVLRKVFNGVLSLIKLRVHIQEFLSELMEATPT